MRRCCCASEYVAGLLCRFLKESLSLGRPSSIPMEERNWIVLSVLAGEVLIAEAARRERVGE